MSSRKIGRNQRCPCGSGQKYKRCCGRVSSTQHRVTQLGAGVLAERDVKFLREHSVMQARFGDKTLTAGGSLANFKSEAARLEQLAAERGMDRRDLSDATGHPPSLITVALTPRAGQPLPLHVLHAIADVLNTSVDLSPSWTLEKATSVIADRLKSRVGEATAEHIRAARTAKDFRALCRRFGGDPRRDWDGKTYSLDGLLATLAKYLDTPLGQHKLPGMLPAIADILDDPDFEIPEQVVGVLPN